MVVGVLVRVLAPLAMAASMLTLAGCQHSISSEPHIGKLTLQFWNGFTGPDGTTMERIVRKFNAEHRDVQVRMQIIPWGTYYDKITLGLAYGGAPDVFVVHASRFPEYADSGALNRIDDLVSAGRIDPNDFTPRVWTASRYGGKRYALPLDCHAIGLYYNTELFKKAGIVDASGNAKPPTNLTEFLQIARKLTKDTNSDGKPDQWGFAYTWLRSNAHTFLAQFGTGMLTRDIHKSDLDSPQALEAMQLMSDIIYKHKVCPPPEGQDAWIGFQTGRVAMAIEGIYMISSLEQQKGLKFAGAPCPMFGRQRAVWADSHFLVMPKSISPQRRRAAWLFMAYLSDHSLMWAKGGQLPVRKSLLSTLGFRAMPVQYQFSKELPYVVYQPASTALNQINPFGDAMVEAVLGASQPTEDALREAAGRINRVLERQ